MIRSRLNTEAVFLLYWEFFFTICWFLVSLSIDNQ